MRRHASRDRTQPAAAETCRRAPDTVADAYTHELASARGTVIGLIVGFCSWVAIILAATALLKGL